MLLRGLLLLVFCLCTSPAWAAVVCGAETFAEGNPPADPLTLVATPSAGTNRVWIVHVTFADTDGDNTTITGVTSSAGGTFTLFGNNLEAGGTDVISTVFYSTDFVDGSQTLSAEFSTAGNQGEINQFVCTGVRTSNPWLGAATTTQSAAGTTGVSIDVPCAVGNLAIDFVVSYDINAGLPTIGADQTSLYSDETGGANNIDSSASTEPGAATNTMSWTSGGDTATWGTVGGCLVQASTARGSVLSLD